MIEEFAIVATTVDIDTPAGTLPAGSLGTVVHIHAGGVAFEVEFSEPIVTVETVYAEHLVPAE